MKLLFDNDYVRDYGCDLDDLSSIGKMTIFLNKAFPGCKFFNASIVFKNDEGYIPREEYNTFDELATKYSTANLEELVDYIILSTTIDEYPAYVTMYPVGYVKVRILKKK